ncbi:hypothetical protein [Flavobacterium luteum]|uniref:Uncharacterized protein n=1 Tax=Flavobacterium luteum TaxID=2026654 RepID=A0A7J5AHD8_9FLAO|nr:hypothetical protein [Flavobacterium luteum]KAB1156913.1 hypothetical protein F6464_06065 [Flavobacterium luteum]
MARLLQEPKEEYLAYLRELIVNAFSKPIVSTNDCKLLEEAIQATINQRLSIDTIARFFNIKKSNTYPSIFTLDTFSCYIGYSSWEGLTKSYSEQNELYQKAILFDVIQNTISLEDLFRKLNACSKTALLHETVNQIILCKVQQKDEAFFKRLFELKIVFEYQESYKYAIYHTIHLLGSLCEQHHWLSEIAINQYYNLPYAENYFVEWLVVPEHRYYMPLLENCYKENSLHADFYHLIHCTHFAETNQWDLFLIHYTKIDVAPKNNMLEMRWLGVQLYHDKQFENSCHREKLVTKIIKHPYTNTKDSGNRVSSIFIICNYLFIIGAYDTIIRLMEHNALKYATILGYWAELNFNQLKVYYAFSLVNSHRKEEALIVFKNIKPDRFDLNYKTRMIAVYSSLRPILEKE